MVQPGSIDHSLGKWLDTDGDGRYDTLEIEILHARGPCTWERNAGGNNEAVFRERILLDKNNQTFFTTRFPSQAIR